MRMSRRMGLYGSKKKYTWAKYNAVKEYGVVFGDSTTYSHDGQTYANVYKSYTIDNTTETIKGEELDGSYMMGQFGNVIGYYFELDGYGFVIIDKSTYDGKSRKYTLTFRQLVLQSTGNYLQGSTSYGTVTSTDPNTYPANGRHTDGYWYVLQ